MNVLLDCARHPVIAHRGASAYAPENTLPAFQLAMEHRVDGCEFDVRVSADGVPIVFHDPTLGRTTDLEGEVAALTLEELRRADAGHRFTPDGGRTFPFRGQGVRIPTLAEVIRTLAGMPLLIELKVAAAMEPVAKLLQEARATDRAVVASFHKEALGVFRSAPFLSGASRFDLGVLLLRARLRWPARRLPYRVAAMPQKRWGLQLFSPGVASHARSAGCPVHVWTVDDPDEARLLWSQGVSGIITNAPDVIQRARREAGLEL
jgi:glycerophosphoryl diester phosphodiesterase